MLSLSIEREGSLRQKLTSPNDIKDNKGSRAKISYERASRAALQKHDTKICIPKTPDMICTRAGLPADSAGLLPDPILMQTFDL